MALRRQLLISSLILLIALAGASFYEDDTNVKVISKKSEFDKEIIQNDGVSVVQFFMPGCGHCQALKPHFSSVAKVVKGVFNVVAIDGTSDAGGKIASQYGVNGFPSLFIFGNDKTKPLRLEKRDAQSMVQALMDEAIRMFQSRGGASGGTTGGTGQEKRSYGTSGQKSAVVQLTDANFKEKVLDNPEVVMVAFVAPWCGYCKQLLPEWEEAAVGLRGQGAMLGVVDATEEKGLASQYGVTGYPTIKAFPGGKKTHTDAQDYQGERAANAIMGYALNEVDRTGVPKEIDELVSQSVWDETCRGQNRICVLVALPHILDSSADGRNSKRELLSIIQKSFRTTFSFLWFEGGSQPDLENALELTFGFPAVVAVSVERQAYAVLKGSFTEKNVKAFLHGIMNGRTKTVKLRGEMPPIVTRDPWDGLDGSVEEEEFSLEDIMGWGESDGGEL